MTPRSQNSQADAGASSDVSAQEVLAASSKSAMATLAKRAGLPPKIEGDLNTAKGQLLLALVAAGKLKEQTQAQALAQHVEELHELQARFDALTHKMEAAEAANDDASAAATAAKEAAAAAAASATAAASDRAAAAEERAAATQEAAASAAAVAASVAADRAAAAEERAEAADGPAQQRLAAQAIVFVQDNSLEALRDQPSHLLEKARELLPLADPATITQATLLKPPISGGKPAPLVVTFCDAHAKARMLAAARRARQASGGAGGGVSVASRLTRWQQERRTALQPQLEQLKAGGQVVRMWCGHMLQKETPNGWVTVPLAAAA
jgi:hypothetical protein